MPIQDLVDVHVLSLAGLGASYRMTGYFRVKSKDATLKINFKGVAFGGHYGGHNVNVEISEPAKKKVMALSNFRDEKSVEELLIEVQRRLLNGEMIVDFEKLKPEGTDPLGNITM